MVTAGSMSADAWGVWLAIKRTLSVAPIPRLAQLAGICPEGQGTNAKQRGRVSDALAELEYLELLERNGGRYIVHAEREAAS